MNGQLSMFTESDILSGKDLAEYEAKVFVIKQIITSCSNRNFIKKAVIKGDKQLAHKWFLDSFRTYGFGFPGRYSFSSYRNEGRINYYYEGEQREFIASPKELFNILMEKGASLWES